MGQQGKAQQVRLFDVAVLGPFMMWYAYASATMPPWARLALGTAGALTVAYNARNYARVRSKGME